MPERNFFSVIRSWFPWPFCERPSIESRWKPPTDEETFCGPIIPPTGGSSTAPPKSQRVSVQETLNRIASLQQFNLDYLDPRVVYPLLPDSTFEPGTGAPENLDKILKSVTWEPWEGEEIACATMRTHYYGLVLLTLRKKDGEPYSGSIIKATGSRPTFLKTFSIRPKGLPVVEFKDGKDVPSNLAELAKGAKWEAVPNYGCSSRIWPMADKAAKVLVWLPKEHPVNCLCQDSVLGYRYGEMLLVFTRYGDGKNRAYFQVIDKSLCWLNPASSSFNVPETCDIKVG